MELGIFRPFFNANIPKPWQKTFWNLSYDNVDTLERIWIFSQKNSSYIHLPASDDDGAMLYGPGNQLWDITDG